MPNESPIHLVIDEIRAYLNALDRDGNGNGNSGLGQLPSKDSDEYKDLARLAEQYARACAEANVRLRECERLINKGLVGEAIHKADQEPALLPLVGLLEFAESEDWVQLTHDLGVESPAPLLLNAAQALDQAYAEMNPIVPLLKQHRKLALSRAGLTPRIALLERLAVIDRTRPIWEEDIREYQQVRLIEIWEDVADAERRSDADELDRLATELKETEWREPPPDEDRKKLRKRAQRLRRENEYQKLPPLADRLLDALAANEEATGKFLREEWNALLEIVRPQDNDPVVNKARPALTWLDEIRIREEQAESRRQAIASLEAGLKAPSTTAKTLRDLAKAIGQFGPLPEPLRKRLDARLLKLEGDSGRRGKIYVGIACATVAALALLWVWNANREASRLKIAKVAADLTSLNDSQKFEDAIGRLDDLARTDPRLASTPEIRKLREATLKARDAERKRVDQFHAAMAKAEADLAVEKPEDLEIARALARTETERGDVNRLDLEREKYRQAQLSKRDQELSPRVGDLASDLREFEVKLGGATPAKELTRELEELAARQRSLAKDLPDESEFRGRLGLLAETIKRLEADHLRLSGQEQDEDRITRALRPPPDDEPLDLDLYVAAIKQFIDKHPDTPRSKDLNTGIEEEPLWRDAMAWSNLLRAWKSEGKSLAKDSEAVRTAVKTYLKDHKDGLSAVPADRLLAHCDAIARRAKSRQDILKLCDAPDMKLYVVNLINGTRYYLTKELKYDRNVVNPYLITPYRANSFNENDRKPITSSDIKSASRAPQYRIATLARDLLETEPPQPWEELTHRILRELKSDKEIDGLLKALIFKEVAKAASSGGEPSKLALAADLKNLEGVNFDTDWTDIVGASATSEREKANRVMERIKIDAILAKAIAERGKIQSLLSLDFVPVGWLAQPQRGTWECRLGEVPLKLRDARLWAGEPTKGGGLRWREIGNLQGGVVSRLDAGSKAVEGRPVFAGGPPGFDE